MIHQQGVKEYFPFYKVKEKRKKKQCNGKCARVQKKRDEAWKRMERKQIQKRKEHKIERNEYVKVRREKI